MSIAIARPKLVEKYDRRLAELTNQQFERAIQQKYDRRSDLILPRGKNLVVSADDGSAQYGLGVSAAGFFRIINYADGNEGTFIINWAKVEGLSQQLTNLRTEFSDADTVVSNAYIAADAQVVSDAAGARATLQQALETAYQAADTSLQNTLQADIDTRATLVQLTATESTLNGSIAQIQSDLTSETTARTSGDATNAAGVATNATGIASNLAAIGLNTAEIANKASISQLTAAETTASTATALVQTNLNAETALRASGDTTNSNAIAVNVADIATNATDIATNLASIGVNQVDILNRATLSQLTAAETTAASATALVQSNLNAETALRASGDSGLQADIDTRATNTRVDSVETAAAAASATNASNLTAETASRVSGDTANTNAIAVNTSGIASNLAAIGTNTADISNRATVAELSAAETTAANATAAVQSNLNAETNLRVSGDTTNSNAITANASDIAGNTTAIGTNTAGVAANLLAIGVNQVDIANRATLAQLSSAESTAATATALVQTNLDAESALRASGDSALQTDINTRATNTRVDGVETTAAAASALNASNLTAETNLRVSGDSTNSAAIAVNAGDIASNLALIGANTLDIASRATVTELNNASSTAASATALVQTNLDAETVLRASETAANSSAIDAVEDASKYRIPTNFQNMDVEWTRDTPGDPASVNDTYWTKDSDGNARVTGNGTVLYLASRGLFPAVVGATYRLSIKVAYTGGTLSSGTFFFAAHLRGLSGSYAYIKIGAAAGENYDGTDGAFQDLVLTYTCTQQDIDDGIRYFRPSSYATNLVTDGDVIVSQFDIIGPGQGGDILGATISAQAGVDANSTAITTANGARAALETALRSEYQVADAALQTGIDAVEDASKYRIPTNFQNMDVEWTRDNPGDPASANNTYWAKDSDGNARVTGNGTFLYLASRGLLPAVVGATYRISIKVAYTGGTLSSGTYFFASHLRGLSGSYSYIRIGAALGENYDGTDGAFQDVVLTYVCTQQDIDDGIRYFRPSSYATNLVTDGDVIVSQFDIIGPGQGGGILGATITAQAGVDTNSTAITNANAARAALETALRSEYQAADANLQGGIDAAEADIATRATSTALASAEATAASASATNASNLAAEITNRTNADSALQTDINTRATSSELTTVETNATSSRAALESSLRSEFQSDLAPIQYIFPTGFEYISEQWTDQIAGSPSAVPDASAWTSDSSQNAVTSADGTFRYLMTKSVWKVVSGATYKVRVYWRQTGVTESAGTNAISIFLRGLNGSYGYVKVPGGASVTDQVDGTTDLQVLEFTYTADDADITDGLVYFRPGWYCRSEISTGQLIVEKAELVGPDQNSALISEVTEVKEALSTGSSSFARLQLRVNTSTNAATFEAYAGEGDGTWNGSSISLTANEITLNGNVLTTGTVQRTAMDQDERDALGAEGTAANFYRQTTDPGSKPNGAWWADQTNDQLKIRIAGAWETIANIASSNPLSVTANKDRAFYVGSASPQVTESVTVTASGGATPYSFAWTLVTGSDNFSVGDDDAATTTFSTSADNEAGEQALYRCTVTDNNGSKAYIDIGVSAIYISYSGGL